MNRKIVFSSTYTVAADPSLPTPPPLTTTTTPAPSKLDPPDMTLAGIPTLGPGTLAAPVTLPAYDPTTTFAILMAHVVIAPVGHPAIGIADALIAAAATPVAGSGVQAQSFDTSKVTAGCSLPFSFAGIAAGDYVMTGVQDNDSDPAPASVPAVIATVTPPPAT